MDSYTVIQLFIGFIGLILLFAQIKMFSIAKDVERIRQLMEERGSD